MRVTLSFAATSVLIILLSSTFALNHWYFIGYFALALLYAKFELNSSENVLRAEVSTVVSADKIQHKPRITFTSLGLVDPRVFWFLFTSKGRSPVQQRAWAALVGWSLQIFLATLAGYLLLERAP